jgi:hypothetical protein
VASTGRECDRAETGSAANAGLNFQETVRPASLLRKSILDGASGIYASGCTATFKLCAMPIHKKYLYFSNGCRGGLELGSRASLLISGKQPKN